MATDIHHITNIPFAADQSAWIYFRFVLDWAKPPLPHKLSNKEVRDYVDLLSEQMIPLKELIEDENAENKWR